MIAVAKTNSEWAPNWVTHPGEHLAEHIEARGWSQGEFARMTNLSPKLVSTIVGGKNPVTAETAIRLERVLGVRAYIWTGLQAKWDLHQARVDDRPADNADAWLNRFPISELKKGKKLPDTRDKSVLLDALLALLGVGTAAAYEKKVAALAVHHRQSRAYESSRDHVFTWLLLGEAKARAMNLSRFDQSRFLQGIAEIRTLTVKPPEVFGPRMKALCRASGVALILEKPLSKTCLFGSARWFDADRAIIQMSLRMKTNDHFWWTFFHEAGHITLHRGRNFLDDKAGEGTGVEDEADEWARRQLFGTTGLSQLLSHPPKSKSDICAAAAKLGLHAGIIVGTLQHHKKLPYHHMNGLKQSFCWADEAAD
jgi:HTH-type transcriptional regulator / antitoxin HigA